MAGGARRITFGRKAVADPRGLPTGLAITPVTSDDVASLAAIARRTFVQTFAADNDGAALTLYLDTAFSVDQLLSEMRNANSRFFLIHSDDLVAGYLKLNEGAAQTETLPGRTLEIERIYVDAQGQGKGIGKALFRFALEQARIRDAEAILLGVWEHNAKAIAFYEKQGFRAVGEHKFLFGTEAQRDILMRLDLN